MSTVGSNRSGWMRLWGAGLAFALFLLGLGIAGEAGSAAAGKGKAGKGKKGGGFTKKFVAHSRADSNAKAIVKARFNAAGVPVRVTLARVVNADGTCSTTDPALISEPIETTYKYPRTLKIYAKNLRGKNTREFSGRVKSASQETRIAGEFDRGSLVVLFRQVSKSDGPQIPGLSEPVELTCDTDATFRTGGKSARGQRGKDKESGKTRDRGSRHRAG